MASAAERREELKGVFQQAAACTRCAQLASSRTTVVFGSGNADAELMFVGEAPGANEDKQGLPFVGQAGRLLEQLLGEIGLARADVFIANVLKCLSHDAEVQLGDGTWAPIGRLARDRYSGTVMSVGEGGKLVPRRVTGWHATPLGGRRVLELTYRSARGAGIRLTGDHPVLTERGYVPAAELRAGDRVATGQGLSATARDAIYGTLLGAGSIAPGRPTLELGHPPEELEYACFKAALVGELGTVLDQRRVAAVAGGPPQDDAVNVRTAANRALDVVRRDFYRPRKGVPQHVATTLNARRLAIWFMDDGCTRVRPARPPVAEIATVGFDDDDLQVLLAGLRRLGLSAKASRRRLYFDVAGTRDLSRLIAPFVPPSMRHKLHPDIEAQVPFDPSGWEVGAPEVLFDEVEISDVSDRPGEDTAFFCIDVEETHNFVTAGGVVHNCRPPGNRDPLPQEIESCQEYLFRQLELIQPRVVCTLGNFSTKLLRGDPLGITRLHGRSEVRQIGPRTVRLYPLFHPAAALYTPSMLATLREDFSRIPELLALPAPAQVEPEPELEPELALVPAEPEPEPAAEPQPEPEQPRQLGLF
ncbi:uracil-DNA glycosylase family protein [Candidatus Solirubrobacter pratensis]|uniref:uracil-DNA glycosylase family protein n=1 Tax=Candidatus Solirubrobacter pratensis TaxID=1298857 RepID=UPI00042A59D3|nr:uracil-DNA glycosylase family protein [Candidatus Solirubrobacter pratensis]